MMGGLRNTASWANRFNQLAYNPRFTEFVLITAVTLLGGFLRFFHLGTWSFWIDEVFSFSGKSDGFNNSLLRRSLAADLIQLVVGQFGANEWNARFVPALIGAISIPLLYLLLRQCMARPGALAACALLAVSTWHLYWSQNARFYSLLFLFFNLGLLLFYLGLERDRPVFLLLSLFMFGMAARERLAALLGMPALVFYLLLIVLLRFPRPRGMNQRNLALFFGPALVAGLVMIFPYARNLSGWFTGFGRINNSPFFLLAGTVYYTGTALVVTAGLTALIGIRQKNRLALLLMLSAGLPLAFLMALSLIQYTANRYIFFTLFSWVALAALGIQFLAENLPRSSRALALLVVGALLAASAGDIFLYFATQNGNRDDWRGAFAYISEHAREGDTVIATDPDIARYYLSSSNLQVLRWDSDEAQPTGRVWYVEDMNVAEMYPQQLEQALASAQPMADFDVRLPGRTYRMRVYFGESP